MTCPNCGAPIQLEAGLDHFFCQFCGNDYAPEPNEDGVVVLGEPASTLCPVCAVPLLHAAVAVQRLLCCGQCRGALLEIDVFAATVRDLRVTSRHHRMTPRPPDWSGLQRTLLCPECRMPMHAHLYGAGGNVIMDTCERCEVHWLDRGELTRIACAADPTYS